MSDVVYAGELSACVAPGCKIQPLRICDWRAGGTRCGAPLCAFHASSPADRDEVDLCPEHMGEWLQRLARREAP